MRGVERILLYLLLIGGVVYALYFIWTGVPLPFFGDELGGYAAAIHHQVENGISLAPNATPYKYTFGHPQMHTVFMAPMAMLFGTEPIGLHLSGLLISAIGISLLIYYLRNHLKMKWYNLTLLIIVLIIQPVFLAQSYLVHSEMLLMIWFGLTILLAWHKQFLWASLIASLAILTKETGAYLICVIPCIALYQYYQKEYSLKRLLLNASIILIPTAVFVMYIWVQKDQMGFYLSPTNMGKTTANLDGVYHKFLGALKFVFLAQNRFIITALFVTILMLKKIKQFGYLKRSLFIILSFCLASAILSHPIERYLLFPIAVWVLTAVYYTFFRINGSRILGLLLMLIVLGMNVLQFDYFKSPEFSDSDLTYRQCIANTEQTIAYINEHSISPIVFEFPYNFSQEYTYSGYTKVNSSIVVLKEIPDTFHYRVFSWPGNMEHKIDTQGYKPVARIKYPYSYSVIKVKN